jgi:hypothetical protein
LYRLGMFIGIIPMLAAVLGKLAPSAFWWGLLIAVIVFVAALVMANRHTEKEVEKTSQSKPGFSEFYKLYLQKDYWPEKMADGEKSDKFLSILGRKASE